MIYRCGTCKNTEGLQFPMWVDVNTGHCGEIENDGDQYGDWYDSDSHWCPKCKSHEMVEEISIDELEKAAAR